MVEFAQSAGGLTMSDAQQVALIQTLLYFIGHQQYTPTAAQVESQLQAFTKQATAGSGTSSTTIQGGWDVSKNQKF
jgi:hypothetical protein